MKFFKKSVKFVSEIFFVNQGERSGQFLLFLEFDKNKELYSVLTLPECEPIFISKKEIENYNTKGFVEFVEKVPDDILNESLNEFNYRISQLKV